MKHVIPFLFCIVIAQENYEGQITLDYNGTVNGSFNSIVQDSVLTGFAYNQIGLDTSFFLMASITQQDTNEFDLFVAFLQDTTFPVQPRTWEIPGGADETNPLSFQNIVVLIPGIDSTFVNDLFGFFTDSSSNDLPINLLEAKIVSCALVTACLFAGCPINFSSFSKKATTEGVVLAPSAFSKTFFAAFTAFLV